MKATVDRLTLTTALSEVMPAIPSKTSYPVLQNVRLAVAGNVLTLAATDLDVFAVRTVALTGPTEDGAAVAPARKLAEVLKHIEDTEVALSVTNGKLTAGYVTLEALDPAEFPELPARAKCQPAVTMPGDVLNGLLAKVNGLQSRDESRPAMMALEFDYSPKHGLKLTTTDGHRLAHVEHKGDLGGQPITALLHSNLLKFLPDKPKRGQPWPAVTFGHEAITQGEDGKDIAPTRGWLLVGDGLAVTYLLVEGPFPDWQRLLPKKRKAGQDFPLQVTLDREGFRAMLRAVQPFAHPQGQLVALTITPDSLSITAETPELGRAEKSMPAKVKGQGLMPKLETCPDCEGQKEVACAHCDGTGKDKEWDTEKCEYVRTEKPCPYCNGTLKETCSTCHGVGQIVPERATYEPADTFRAGFNCGYMLDLLRRLDGDTVTMKLRSPVNACLFVEGGLTLLIMPIRLG